ncbi:MAG: FAD-dependent oxidoreductase, partial [Rubrobacteraceae bacterium]
GHRRPKKPAQVAALRLPATANGGPRHFRQHRGECFGTPQRSFYNTLGGFLNNAVQISNVSRSYAPDSQELVCAVALGSMEQPDGELYRRGVEEISAWYPTADLRPLAIYRIPFAQFAQPPGIHGRLPANRTTKRGLVLAGEYTEDSSINGSMLSGEKAALEVLKS